MVVWDIIISILLLVGFLVIIGLLIKKWRARFVYILLAGIGVAIFSLNAGLGLAVIILLSYWEFRLLPKLRIR